MKIAQFCDNIRPQLIQVFEEGNISASLPMYTRVSEWIDVEFPQLPAETHRPRQLEALNREEQELREKLSRVEAVRATLKAP